MSLLELVRLTARVSAIAFAVALAAPALWRRAAKHSADLFLGFFVAHTVHLAVVVSFALAVPGAALFPQGRTLDTGGGWPAVLGTFAVFYVTAVVALLARRAPERIPRSVDAVATVFLGFMFVATYVPMIERSVLFALPVLMLIAAVLLWARSRFDPRCLRVTG